MKNTNLIHINSIGIIGSRNDRTTGEIALFDNKAVSPVFIFRKVFRPTRLLEVLTENVIRLS